MAYSVPPLPPFPFPVPSTCMWCASAILNNVVARWVHSGVASQPGGGSAAYRVRLRRLLLVAREQAAGPLPPDRPTIYLLHTNGTALCPSSLSWFSLTLLA